jgi:hypothetical protein
MPVLIPLLSALGEFFAGLGEFILALATAYWMLSAQGSTAHAPELNASILLLSNDTEILFGEFQREMDLQYEVGAMARYMRTLPALPEEGY